MFKEIKRTKILIQLISLQSELIHSNTSKQYEQTKQKINTLKKQL